MLNRNFANLISTQFKDSSFNNGRSIHLLDLTGEEVTPYWSSTSNSYPCNRFFWQIANIVTTKLSSLTSDVNTGRSTFTLGSGNTSESIEDYNLEFPIDETNFTILSNNRAFTADNYSNNSVTFSQVWTYAGESAIEIKEIGFVSNISINPGNNVSVPKNFLFDRTVLDNPITVTNGDTFTISLTIGGKATVVVNS